MSHTPGPWEILEGGNFVQIGAKGYTVAELDRMIVGELYVDHQRAMGNAHLIAAAPDLLEALSDTVCNGCGHRIGWARKHDADQAKLGRGDWKSCHHCKDARAAIAKAEGR